MGQAALALVRALGATPLATAGRPEKRALLRAQGVEHVFDSRSADFVDGVRAATGGRGVDVVLNCLAGDLLRASLSLLAPRGRHVELGKA
ncbi:MAG: zinc-binding dehydrogenase, partial [bacterium]